MIRNIILSLIMIVGLYGYAEAQTDNRTRETKIADIVMLLPAENSPAFNKLMGELYSLGNVVGDLSPRLAEPGGKDAQIRYAIAGLTTFASKNTAYRPVVAKELCKAVQSAASDEIRDFLMIQLQYVAGEESIETAANYLDNNRLSDAAARILVRIGTSNAYGALKKALDKITGSGVKPNGNEKTLVQAIGEMPCNVDSSVAGITAMLSTPDAALKKVALHTLAAIAAQESEKVLGDAAAKAGYVYEPTEALSAYLLYIKNIINKKQSQQALDASKKLLGAVSETKQLAAKSAALKLYVEAAISSTSAANESKAVTEILAALKSSDKQYRLAALDCSALVQNPSSKMYDGLMNIALKDKNPETRADVIRALGSRACCEIKRNALVQNPIQIISEKCLTDSNTEVCRASIEAIGRIYNANPEGNYVSRIIAAMSGNDEVVETGKQTLLSLKSFEVIDEIEKAMKPNNNGPGASILNFKNFVVYEKTKNSTVVMGTPKGGAISSSKKTSIALIEILAARKANWKFDVVYAQTKRSDNDIRRAAIAALKDVSGEKDAPRVAKLLDVSSEADMTALLQDALYAAVSTMPVDEQTKRVTGLMKTGRNPVVYYNVYAKIGGVDALHFVLLGMKSEHDADAAFDALTNWSDGAALASLFDIAKSKNKYSERALNAYISKIGTSKNKPEQKLLMLRNALDISQTDGQKVSILKSISHTGTFLGLLTAGELLDSKNNAIQQAAVQAVRIIALSNKGFYGAKVSELLNRAIAVNRDAEAGYQKEEIMKHLASLPKDNGFVSMFNGKDLSGWKGLVDNPIARGKMTAKQLEEKQKKADEIMIRDWSVQNGMLVFDGKGYDNLCSVKQYGDFEMYVDWKIAPEGDAGIYLRGSPQVQIWDTALHSVGAQVGSGGLYNNQKHESKPLTVADNAVNEWNSFHIVMVGDKVTVHLNGQLVTDGVILENYWNRSIPIFGKEQIELQAHGNRVEYRDIYVREIPRPEPYEVSETEKAEGFVPMFNGVDMSGWTGNLKDYVAHNGTILCNPVNGGHGNLYTEKEYSDFVMRFEFRLTPAANNGLGIRTPLEGDAAYVGMELQILDNEAEVYKNLEIYQYHGSVYGVIPAKRGFLKPTGEWNVQEVTANGNRIKIVLNGTVILDGDIAKASKNFTETADHKVHPGLSNKSGHIGFLGHGSEVEFKNLRIKNLKK